MALEFNPFVPPTSTGGPVFNPAMSFITPDQCPEINLYELVQNLSAQDLNTMLTQAQKNSLFPYPVLKTFQTTVIAAGDDGSTQNGRGGNTVTLLPPGLLNSYGTNFRFADNQGRNPFIDNIRRDFLTGLMWYYDLARPVMTWANALADAAAFSYLGYDDWRLPNENELLSIRNMEGPFAGGINNVFSYSVFFELGGIYWTSGSSPDFLISLALNSAGRIEGQPRSNTYHVPLVRTMTS